MIYNSQTKANKRYDDILQHFFPSEDFAAHIVLDEHGDLELVSIDIRRKTEKGFSYVHYANIQKYDDKWELNEQFIKIDERFCKRWGCQYVKYLGSGQTAMNIYGYYKTFINAVRSLDKKGQSIKNRKPIGVYV